MTIPEPVLKQIVWQIHGMHELAGCVVGYYGDRTARTIGWPSCVTLNSENVAVVVEELSLQGSATAKIVTAPTARQIVTNRSRLGTEVIGAAGACTLAAVSGVGVIGGVAAEVPTAGASTFLVVASWTGFAMGAIQCGNGLIRVGAALADLGGNSLEEWDKNQIYSVGILLVDGVGVASGVTTLPFAVRDLWAVVARMRQFNAMNLSFDALKQMNRLERLRALAKVFKDATRSHEGGAALLKAAQDAQVSAKTLNFAREGLSVRHANTLRKIIGEETVKRLHAGLLNLGGNVAGIGFSATEQKHTGSGSGSVNWVIHLLDAGEPNFD
jgi:hypothetical protein